jgi:hypothetical protein
MLSRSEILAVASKFLIDMEGIDPDLEETDTAIHLLKQLVDSEPRPDPSALPTVINLAKAHVYDLESRFRGLDNDFAASAVECGRLAIADAEIFLAETPESIGQWVDSTFPGGNDRLDRHALRCLRECVEWCIDAGASKPDIFGVVSDECYKADVAKTWGRKDKVPWEMADVVIVACGAARKMGVNLWEYVVNKMKTNRSRTWEDHGDGTGQHTSS